MHSSFEFPKSPQTGTDGVLAVDVQSVRPIANRSVASSLPRIIVACEILADLFTITLAIRFGYLVYGTIAIGKHVQFPIHLIWGTGAVFAVVVVLMLDRAGAYRSGNSLLRVRETEQILRVSAEGLL